MAFLLQLNEKPSLSRIEKLAEMLRKNPNFDLLIKTYVELGQKLKIDTDFYKQQASKWELKKEFYLPGKFELNPEKKIDQDLRSIPKKLEQFLERFKPILNPFK